MKEALKSDAPQTPGSAFIHFCPNCETSRIMALDSIRPAIFRGNDVITYKCRTCGTEMTEIMK
jgi:predicted RNA-binding Zn-ribbon protein involved in translation (DUF1610 family)